MHSGENLQQIHLNSDNIAAEKMDLPNFSWNIVVKLQSRNVHFNSAVLLVAAEAEGRPRFPDVFVVSDSDKKNKCKLECEKV